MFSLNARWAFQVHGNAGGHHDDGVAGILGDFLVALEGTAGHAGVDMLTALLPGIANMANLHPLAVHFPIALLVMFFVAELAGFCFRQTQWRTMASGLLYLGTVSAAVTVYLGVQAAETVAHGEAVHVIMEKHEAFGFTILSVAVLLSLWRLFFGVHKHWLMQVLYLFAAAFLNVLIVLGADLGGMMVYQYGVAVKAIVSPSVDTTENKHDHHEHSHGDQHRE